MLQDAAAGGTLRYPKAHRNFHFGHRISPANVRAGPIAESKGSRLRAARAGRLPPTAEMGLGAGEGHTPTCVTSCHER